MKKTNVALVTVAVFVATFMTAVEGTIVTTAMPTIVGSLHGIEIMNWVFSIYLLTNAMLTPIYGKLADKIGRKPIFLFGTFLFIIGSALCGMSHTMLTLIISRGIQGMGAGAMMPVALTIIADLYTTEKRARILGLNSTAWGIASVAGPLAGGLIVETVGWHWIFFINVPIGLLLMGMIWFYLVEPKSATQMTKKMDVLGSFLLMGTLLALLLGFQTLSDYGSSLFVGLIFLLSVILFGVFIIVEKRAEDPVISLDLFKSRIFVAVNVIAALVSGFLMGIDVYIPIWMQGVLGYNAGIGGLVLAPLSILWMFGTFLASRWMTNHSLKWVLTASILITLVGGTSLFLLPAQSHFMLFVVISSVIGIGLGATIVTCTVSAQNSVPSSQLGVATSFNTLVRTIGQTVMVSVFGICFNVVTAAELKKSLIPDRDILNKLVNPQTAKLLDVDILGTVREILYQGLHVVFGIGVALVALALVFTRIIQEKSATIEENGL